MSISMLASAIRRKKRLVVRVELDERTSLSSL